MTKPADVVFVLPDLGRGGAQRVVLTLAAHLDPTRFTARLLVVGGSQALVVPDHLPAECGRARRLGRGLPWLARRLRRLGPQVVVSTPAYANLALLALAPVLPRSTRLVVREANMPESTLASLPRSIRLFRPYRRLYPRATLVLAQTRTIAEALVAKVPNLGDVLRILPNPVDISHLQDMARPPRRVPGPGLRLVAAGRLTRQKGFHRLVDLMLALPSDARLTIFGDGPDHPALARRVAELGLTGRVTLAAYTTELPAHLAGADAFVMASLWEGLPNVALESLALGTPVLATPESGLSDLERSAPGAVSVIPFGAGFAARLAAVVPAGDSPTARRPSLLPHEYTLRSVISQFESILIESLEQP